MSAEVAEVVALKKVKNENFRNAVNAFLAITAKEHGAVLRTRYEIGRLAADVKKKHDESEGKHYGTSDPLKDMSSYVDAENDRSFLNECRLYFEIFTGDQMEAMCQRRADGSTMAWNHVRYLRVIKVEEVRCKFLQQCIRDCWTATKLRKEIAALSEADRGRANNEKGQGRPIVKPTSVAGVIEQEEVWTTKLADRLDVWNNPEHSLVAHLRKEAASMTKDELQRVSTTIQKRREASDDLVAQIQRNSAILAEAISITQAALERLADKERKAQDGDDEPPTPYQEQEGKKYGNSRRRLQPA